jgi:hypothetical protein
MLSEKLQAGLPTLSILSIVVIGMFLLWKTVQENKWGKIDELGHSDIILWDVTSYYSYLPALFVHGDLSMRFTDQDANGFRNRMEFWPETSANGNYVIKTTMGLAFLYAPSFVVAHSYCLLSGHYLANGFSAPYEIALMLGQIIWFVVGFIFLRKILLNYFPEAITAITLLSLFFASNLYYISIYKPGLPHIYNFSLSAIFIYCTIRWLDKRIMKYAFFLALTIGLLTLIRPINILFLVFPLLFGVSSKKLMLDRIKFLIANKVQILFMILIAFLVILPQMLYWKTYSGDWLYYSYGHGERFFFTDPKILEGLFSYRKGWLLYTPLMTLAILGLLAMPFAKRIRSFSLPLLLLTSMYIFVVYSWWCWWYGGGFGSRPMIDLYAFLIIPLAYVVDRLSRSVFTRVPTFLLIVAMGGLNVFQSNQATQNLIHWDGTTKESYWYQFLKAEAQPGYWDLIKRPDYEKARANEAEYVFKIGLPDFEALEAYRKSKEAN